jgi:heterodisulfide reductase subunit A2
MTRKIGTAMVVGAGISGIRAALDLAEFGYGVTLVDRASHLGGLLTQLDYQFPTNRCGMCKMLPLVDRDAASQHCLRRGLFHENIEILLSTEVVAVDGEPGKFEVTLKQRPQWVDPNRCVGCGNCVEVCPVEIADDFNAGFGTRKAIHLPLPHALPNSYVIEVGACTRCGACAKACPTGAIRMPEEERRKFRILVVDDELVVRDSLKEWLEEEGFTAGMAASGPEALDALARDRVHLMLLDIKMPGMDGVEVLQRAKELFPELTVIMMTAYATIDTAVEAMKIGAMDYLVKPFEVETLLPKVVQVFQELEAAEARRVQTGALLLCSGTRFFDPREGKNTLGYGIHANVLTSVEFERLVSGSGPTGGQLVRPDNGQPVHRIAWIQCVGSRDLQTDADFCSTICCMSSIKEALLAKAVADGDLETAIFYMDMRTFGKSYQRYQDQAQTLSGVRFERGRIHSVEPHASNGELLLRWVDATGGGHSEIFDMAVLAVGQRPGPGSLELGDVLGISRNPWGFANTEPFSLTRTSRAGIVIGGTFNGMKDIREAVIQASAAAVNASRVLHAAGGSLRVEEPQSDDRIDLDREPPKILAVICACGRLPLDAVDPEQLSRELRTDPAVREVKFLENLCTSAGWQELVDAVRQSRANRLLIGACLPEVIQRKLKALSREVGLHRALMEAVDLHTCNRTSTDLAERLAALRSGVAKLKWIDPKPTPDIPVTSSALVVGGGIAGMTAALAIADHGYQVDLVEAAEQLGGNLNWLSGTLEGHDVNALLQDSRTRVQAHPKIVVHLQTRVLESHGQVGGFATSVAGPPDVPQTIHHGVTILATGGVEAVTSSFGYGTHPAILTQSELEKRLRDRSLDPKRLSSVAMILCVDSRQEPRNYCSRVCCPTALKHALGLKAENPDMMIYVLYRDMMTTGFSETYYTQARRAGVMFIQYDLSHVPQVRGLDQDLEITVFEPILGKSVQIEANLAVLATGVVPRIPAELAQTFGVNLDQDGFFQEADFKWRPVDALKEGVFACGLVHSPRNVVESIATGEAAAQRALRILVRERLPAGKIVAQVRHSLCSLCEQCIDACPYGARTIDADLARVLVNPVMCQGCGVCASVCPNDAAVLEGYPAQQMLETIDAALS